MTFAEYVGFYGAGPLRGAGAALPRRRVQGAAPDGAGGRPDRGARPTSSSGSASWSGRSTRSLLDEWERLRNPGAEAAELPLDDTPAGRSPATCGRSGCWSATRCSAGSSWPRCAATTSWASSTPRPAGTPTTGQTRSRTTSTSTTSSAPARTRAARRCCSSTQQPDRWAVRQIFDDPAGDHDWGITAEVDLAESDELGRRRRPRPRGRPAQWGLTPSRWVGRRVTRHGAQGGRNAAGWVKAAKWLAPSIRTSDFAGASTSAKNSTAGPVRVTTSCAPWNRWNGISKRVPRRPGVEPHELARTWRRGPRRSPSARRATSSSE